MGSGQSYASASRFRQQLLQYYRPDQSLIHQTFGGIDLYASHQTKRVQLFVKEFTLMEQALLLLQQRLKNRMNNPHPNLIRILEVVRNANDAICGTTDSLLVYCEYLDHSLKRELARRRQCNMIMYSQKQLCRMLHGLLAGLAHLHSGREFHGELKLADVLMDNQSVRLVDRSLVVNGGWSLDLANQNITILQGRNILFAPSIMRCLENRKTQIEAYDPFKADVFSVGMVMLEVSTLQDSTELYDYQRFVIDRSEINNRLKSVTYRYSKELAALLGCILTEFDDQRPNAIDLLHQLLSLQIVTGYSAGQPFNEWLLL